MVADGPEFGLERFYLKDLSFESPRSPEVFTKQWQPEVQLDINSKTRPIGEDRYEVVLTVTINAKSGDDGASAMIIEVQQAGIFRISGLADDQLKRVTSTLCPNVLFPYVRENVDNLAVKGGFPPMMLAPVNFDLLYEEALKQQAQGDEEAPPVQH